MKTIPLIGLLLISSLILLEASESPRERILMDSEWKFALGHATDAKKDFNHGTSYFSYWAKTGYGDGPAAAHFDDRSWRVLDLPHDWCVELPFDPRGSHSHGYKAIGQNFPENSIGWYRKKFFIPESDLGKRIIIQFEGVHRYARVWVNGFYCGTNHSGYYEFEYDVTEYINYGGENVISVRVDATMEEGWYYEGAGIYRHVWLVKTNPVHIPNHGTFITTDLQQNNTRSIITTRITVVNKSFQPSTFDIEEIITDPDGKVIAQGTKTNLSLFSGAEKTYYHQFKVDNPKLWSLETPQLHQHTTIIKSNGKIIDQYVTTFGIRTVRFDADSGFFLNGKNIKIVGTNCHQDHAGVGIAIPDALYEFRIKKLKEMGNNGLRTSHNPPSTALLDICDRLGMLVLDENRLMGVNDEHFYYLENMIKRDRNHPCVVLWSLGNEEWAIEGNEKGARIASYMQAYANRLDSSRMVTTAISGGWDYGIGKVLQVMGYNYIVQGDIDEHHRKFPRQAGIGTEESNTVGTRGIYFTDEAKCHLAPTNRMPENVGTESGWKFYAERPFLAGLFYWTGFDYRGEPTPFGWPAIASQFGIVDLCGFPKDIFYYLKSWWGNEPVLHIFPHWNLKGHEGQQITITAYSNCDEVELICNGKNLGKKRMPVNGHLTWNTVYQPGSLIANGYKNGKRILTKKIETTDQPSNIQLQADRNILRADNADVAVVTVKATDLKGRVVPTADNLIYFEIEGPGKIIGVGNGDPSSHEKDQYIDSYEIYNIENLKEKPVPSLENLNEINENVDDSNWIKAFSIKHKDWRTYVDTLLVVRGTFTLPEINERTRVTLFSKSILENQSIYVNGVNIASNIKRDDPNQSFVLDHKILKPGNNTIAYTGQRFRLRYQWDEPNTDPGVISVWNPAEQWRRKLFNGYAQVIIQSTNKAGKIILKASSDGLKSTSLIIESK